jgi:hypothetical protein
MAFYLALATVKDRPEREHTLDFKDRAILKPIMIFFVDILQEFL